MAGEFETRLHLKENDRTLVKIDEDLQLSVIVIEDGTGGMVAIHKDSLTEVISTLEKINNNN